MFQSKLNSALNYDLFDISNLPDNYDGRFMCSSFDDNKYTTYLKQNSTIKPDNNEIDIDFVLQAISYNSSSNARQWRMPVLSYRSYDHNRQPLLSASLSKKIIDHMLPEFKTRVQNLLLDYHILLDVNDNPISIERYPDVMLAIGYFEAFSISYFDWVLTGSELMEIKSAVNSRKLICFDKKNNRIIVHDIDENHFLSPFTITINDTRTLLTVIITLLNKNNISSLNARLTAEDIDSLIDILY